MSMSDKTNKKARLNQRDNAHHFWSSKILRRHTHPFRQCLPS